MIYVMSDIQHSRRTERQSGKERISVGGETDFERLRGVLPRNAYDGAGDGHLLGLRFRYRRKNA